ncbi:hypothetical protein AQ477_00995 [Burkholderia thailandensis]|nr:hypothetical protein AQ477_00995 [Burkholderia thailandensis]KXF59840.1 hypothetical protein AQ476_00120 [Burkholderia thailandensis]
MITGCVASPTRTTLAASVFDEMSPPKRRSSVAWRYRGMPYWYLPVMIHANADSVSSPRAMMRVGAGVTLIPRSQHGHAYLTRWC